MRYLYFLIPTIITYASFYIWIELLPDGKHWYSTPTYIALYMLCILSLFGAIGEFTKAKPK